MPCWLAACLDLLSGPFIGYCIALRKLALQAGLARPTGTTGTTSRSEKNVLDPKIKANEINSDDNATMPPCAEEKIKGTVTYVAPVESIIF